MVQRYENESKSQPFSYWADEKKMFPMVQRYENESKSQRIQVLMLEKDGCFLWFKDTKMKANHNHHGAYRQSERVVSYGSKIRK